MSSMRRYPDHLFIGSRTGQNTVLFDGVTVIGITTTFVASDDKSGTLPTISWSAKSSNGSNDRNVFIQLDHTLPATEDGPNGDRKMNAMIWKDGDPKPDDFTHSGLDFFSDVGMFNGTYTTLFVTFMHLYIGLS